MEALSLFSGFGDAVLSDGKETPGQAEPHVPHSGPLSLFSGLGDVEIEKAEDDGDSGDDETLLKPLVAASPPELGDDDEVRRILAVTPEDCEVIAGLDQGTEEWLQSRRPGGVSRFTGSVISGLLGKSPYDSQARSVREQVSSTFKGNFFTRWGSKHESVACASFLQWAKKEFPDADVSVRHSGLVVCVDEPFLAYSPDGDVTIKDRATGHVTRALLEIKCPASRKYRYHADPNTPIYGDNTWCNGSRGPAPINYWYQMQLGCFVLGRSTCFFAVWNPSQIQVSRVDFDEAFFLEKTLPLARRVFWEQYVPQQRAHFRAALRSWKYWDSAELPSDTRVTEGVRDEGVVTLVDGPSPPTVISAARYELKTSSAEALRILGADAAAGGPYGPRRWVVRVYFRDAAGALHDFGPWLTLDVIGETVALVRARCQGDHDGTISISVALGAKRPLVRGGRFT